MSTEPGTEPGIAPPQSDADQPSITALRSHLFDAIRAIRAGTLEVDKARAINELGKTLVDTARVEVDFLRETGGDKSPFIAPADKPAPPNGITTVVQHRLK